MHIFVDSGELKVRLKFVSQPPGDPVTLTYDSSQVSISYRNNQQIIPRPNASAQLLSGMNFSNTVLTRVMNDLGITGTVES